LADHHHKAFRRIGGLIPLLALAALSACSGEEKPLLYCPKVAVLSEARQITRSAGSQSSEQNDVAAMILDVRVTGVAGICKTSGEHRVMLTFRIGFAATSGPAATAPEATLTYFIALTQGDAIIDKKLYPVTFDFKNGATQAVATTTPIRIKLPNVPRSGRQQILVGFQKSPDEMKQGPMR
jgi:hypothetical protein